jgi:Family of unknown function (DUF6295)
MCTGIVENTRVEGSGKGAKGWFPVDQASVSYDHPNHARAESAVIIDITNQAAAPESRIAIELTPDSARNLARAILSSLSRGKGEAQTSLNATK